MTSAPAGTLPAVRWPRSRQTVWLAALVGTLLALAALSFVVHKAAEVRRNQLAGAELYARALDELSASALAGTETILRALTPTVEDPDRSVDPTPLNGVFAVSLRGRPFLRSLSLLDAEGRVLASSNPHNVGLSVAAGLLATRSPDGAARLAPLVSGRDLDDLGREPLTSARVTALPMVLPLSTPRGPVQLVALVNPDHFSTQFERLLERTSLRALLVGIDGRLMVTTSAINLPVGTSLRALRAFNHHLPAREAGSEVAPGAEGPQVLGAFRVLRQWPLVVLVEQPYSVYLAGLAEAVAWSGGFLVVSLAMLTVGTRLARSALLRDERAGAELRAAHAATQASESRKLAILQGALDAIITVDADGRMLEFNPAAQEMFGCGVDELAGHIIGEMVALSASVPGAVTVQSVATGKRIETEARRRDGSRFAVELSLVPVHSGGAQMFTATLRDITARLRAETALRDSEAGARATFEQAAVGVIQQSPDGRLLRVNQTLCDLLGYTRGEVLALSPADLVHADDLASCMSGIGRLFTGESSSFAEDKRFVRKGGSLVWARLTASVARDETGRALYTICIVQDISARRRAEDELGAARQRELQVGARIQQSLLVTAPPDDIEGLQISSFNAASQGIDGDFVEFVRVGPHCVDIIAGDVMGKGAAAALMGAATKLQFSRSFAELMSSNGGAAPQPAAVVAAVHRAMTPSLQALEAFVTLCYLRVDTQRDCITWVGCGHEETLRVRQDGPPLALANQHPPLGVLDSSEYLQGQQALQPGESLFLCSDGVTEALYNNGERVGRDSVASAAANRLRRHGSPAAALHGLRADLLIRDVIVQDDVTMVVVQREPAGSTTSRVELPVQLHALRRVRDFVARHTRSAGLEEGACGLLEVAAVEAFTNIVRHGRGLLPGAPIELLARLDANTLTIRLVHVGEEFIPPVPPEPDLARYPEGGFGLTIIQGASDETTYRHDGGVNTLTLTKRLDRRSAN